MNNYAYILSCADGTFYSGWTNDLEKREQAHNSGKGSKYTRSRRPVRVVYYECFENKWDAMVREAQFKRLSHAEKEKLAKGFAEK